VKFASYIDTVINGGPSNDYYLVANNGFLGRPEAKLLVDDLWTFPEYLDPKKATGQVFFWFGPRGTVTPLHHDIMNVFMSQIYGTKRLLLVAPDQTHLVYNQGVYSEVNPEAPDYDRHPRFRQAQVISAEVGPGDVIFLPVGWWHHVRSLGTSITVSYTNFVFPNQYDWDHPNLEP
jgi:ribosomal protein L16 Arg81 hydroxylase